MKYEPSVDDFVRIALKFIDKSSIRNIVEVGARDCCETVRFGDLFPNTMIYSFECNPDTIPLCKKAIQEYKNIYLIEKAVTNCDGFIKFYPIDTEKTETTWADGNPGASSLLKASGKYPIEKYVQKEIDVKATTLATFMRLNSINCIDLLWIDIQGAELMALQGAGDRIHDVKLIHIEVEFFEIYIDQPLFQDVKRYLKNKGFIFLTFVTTGHYSADAIFINSNIVKNNIPIFLYFTLSKLKFLKHKFKSYSNKLQKHLYAAFKLLIFDSRTWYLSVFKKIHSLGNDNDFRSSHVVIDILITAIEKDLDILPYSIQSIRANVKHPIGRIFIVAPDSNPIKLLCDKENCTFIDEKTILPITKNDINYIVKNHDRSGWLLQQLIKLSGDKICSQEYFLVIDADTVLIQPHVFLYNNKLMLLYSDEYHQPYFKNYYKLLGKKTRSCVSFVSHYMLFHKEDLCALKKEIEEKNNISWYKAIINSIDKTESSGFSEYETYGNFLLSKFRGNIIMRYWFNLSLNKTRLPEISNLSKDFRKKYRAISFHSYNS